MKAIEKLGKVVLLAAVAAVSLAGCGGGGGGGGAVVPETSASVAGTVVDASSEGIAIPGATVVLGDKQVTADGSGRFRFDGLQAGTYQVSVTCGNPRFKAYTSTVTVTGDAETELTVPLLPETVSVGAVTITPPAPDGPGGSYLTGGTYRFAAAVTDAAGVPSPQGTGGRC